MADWPDSISRCMLIGGLISCCLLTLQTVVIGLLLALLYRMHLILAERDREEALLDEVRSCEPRDRMITLRELARSGYNLSGRKREDSKTEDSEESSEENFEGPSERIKVTTSL